jgi:hypothetical protein
LPSSEARRCAFWISIGIALVVGFGCAQVAIRSASLHEELGEDFSTLTAQNSEDQATKLRGRDLRYFSATRLPPDFVEAATKLRPGEASKPMRTRLGFHIVKLIDVEAAREQTFDEVRSDIAVELENQKRAAVLPKLTVDSSPELPLSTTTLDTHGELLDCARPVFAAG